MKIELKNKQEFSEIIKKLNDNNYNFTQEKLVSSEYKFIKGKHKFTISKRKNSIMLTMMPKKMIFPLIIAILFMVFTTFFSWFILHYISKLILIAGGLIGFVLYLLLYNVIFKKDIISEKNKISQIINK